MSPSKQRVAEIGDGGPLAVCINDCQLDYGQPKSKLIRLCFEVQCAFAEMRWGCSSATATEDAPPAVDDGVPTPPQNPGP